MVSKNDNINIQRQVRPSFSEARLRARLQIALDVEGYWGTAEAQAEELALIMTEVYLMDPSAPITISGDRLDGYIVQQMFSQIDESHARLVIENFNRATYLIKNKKLYLRTALYNSVFELSSSYANAVSSDMARGKR